MDKIITIYLISFTFDHPEEQNMVGAQPSWAHVVKGGVSLVVSPPPPPPPTRHQGQQLSFFKLSARILKAGKDCLKVVQKPLMKVFDPVGRIVSVLPATTVVEAASMVVQLSAGDEDVVGLTPTTSALPPQKKAKLSPEVAVPRDPRLRAKGSQLSMSPDLHHKVPSGAEKPIGDDERRVGDDIVHRGFESGVQQVPAAGADLRQGGGPECGDRGSDGEQLHGVLSEGEVRHGQLRKEELQLCSVSEGKLQDDLSSEGCEQENVGVKTNMFGVNFMMWFEIGIEGKDPMDQEEDDWGGKIEFGFSDKKFCKDVEDYFVMFEDECTLQSHNCAGRVARVLENVRDRVIGPPDYDPRSIVELLDKYGDGHISDSGWREVDQEEWFDQ